jgi:hypothetical protein
MLQVARRPLCLHLRQQSEAGKLPQYNGRLPQLAVRFWSQEQTLPRDGHLWAMGRACGSTF